MKRWMIWLLIAAQMMMIPGALADIDMVTMPQTDEMSFARMEELIANEEDFVMIPMIGAGEHADAINAAVREKAQIAAFENIMTYGTGSAGLQVYPDVHLLKGNVYSLSISANGKMPVGRPSQVYYPMTFDLATGDEIPFDALFADPDGAMAYMEEKVAGMEEGLSTHLENSQLLPVPFDRYTIDEHGNMTIWYERDQLSFLSGFGGSVHFRFSELEPYYDLSADGYLSGILTGEKEHGFLLGLGDRNCLGWPLETALKRFRSTIDSEYYPGGASYEVEDAVLQGALLLTDEKEETVLGILISNLDDNGIITGKTTLDEARALLGNVVTVMAMDENIAAEYRVCAGESLTYRKNMMVGDEERTVSYTLYADEEGIVQYLKLALE